LDVEILYTKIVPETGKKRHLPLISAKTICCKLSPGGTVSRKRAGHSQVWKNFTGTLNGWGQCPYRAVRLCRLSAVTGAILDLMTDMRYLFQTNISKSGKK